MDTVINVKNLSKSYADVQAVSHISFSVGRGEIFGLLGANGAGKSTTVECILGTKKPDSGTAAILGMQPRNSRKELFERVGVQFQELNYPDKIKVSELCEVTMSLYKKPQDYASLLNQFGLSGKQKALVSELSGGEKQRLFIVLALIPSPDVLFLDELTTGLDARARRDLWKRLAALKAQGLGILLTSHFMDDVETLCDRIMILKKGCCVFHGSVREAIETSPFEKFEDAYLWYSDEEEIYYEII